MFACTKAGSSLSAVSPWQSPLCKVSFWNQTSNEIELTVNGQVVQQRIASERAVVLDLQRDFTWKTNVSYDKREAVSHELNYYDVVVRVSP